MVANTIKLNQSRDYFSNRERLWLFAYGSIIFKTDFEYLEKKPARIYGWSRRFWQGSHDHRGTEANPGRVVTLVENPEAYCDGLALLITPDVFEHLDYREKNGYLRTAIEIEFRDGTSCEGLVYIAEPENAAYLGPAPEEDIAKQVAQSSGPSGSNLEYAQSLAKALKALDAEDDHVYEIGRLLADYKSP